MGRHPRTRMRLRGSYGIDSPDEVAGLAAHAAAAAAASLLLCFCFRPILRAVAAAVPFIPVQALSFALGFAAALAALLAAAYGAALTAMLHTSLSLRFRVARRMAHLVADWAAVRAVLDVGCGRGLLLNTMALRLKREGRGGRAVGVDTWRGGKKGAGGSMAATLRAAAQEGVEQLVTCKTGDARDLPLGDAYFDVVVSALCLHNLGQGPDAFSPAAVADRQLALREMVRVVKPGGQIIVWDLLHAPEYAAFFREQRLEDVSLSGPFRAYMMPSHIVSARKPKGASDAPRLPD